MHDFVDKVERCLSLILGLADGSVDVEKGFV